jgi:tetratricopeptide (TPR) repeat protein
VAKLILRRAVDERMVAAVEEVLFGAGVDWIDADRILSEIEDVDERVAKLRELMARAPDDPNGIIRLVELLASTGRVDEALGMGRRLRDRGLLTVRVVRQLGDVLARSGKEEEAIRTYSEIVEFDASSAGSRMLLGDIYLSRGWFDPAYRQYRQLADANGDAMAWLRLAHAASGAGRVDEALRIDRHPTIRAAGRGSRRLRASRGCSRRRPRTRRRRRCSASSRSCSCSRARARW